MMMPRVSVTPAVAEPSPLRLPHSACRAPPQSLNYSYGMSRSGEAGYRRPRVTEALKYSKKPLPAGSAGSEWQRARAEGSRASSPALRLLSVCQTILVRSQALTDSAQIPGLILSATALYVQYSGAHTGQSAALVLKHTPSLRQHPGCSLASARVLARLTGHALETSPWGGAKVPWAKQRK
ncbi:hypothetical protein NDU88_000286 [Pleurodeles waltl]|uniref:Uncharacterized protein n=1 Tax=Pleurodeles waltl TaxID=8319 RepID=A0AAV7VWX5_PLEWA|nr:hypothetical protein NDU88_000286 [Pleurodeles waltl]